MDCDCAPPPNEPPSISCFSLFFIIIFFTSPVIPPLRSHAHIMHAYARRLSYMYRKKDVEDTDMSTNIHTRAEKHTHIYLAAGRRVSQQGSVAIQCCSQ